MLRKNFNKQHLNHNSEIPRNFPQNWMTQTVGEKSAHPHEKRISAGSTENFWNARANYICVEIL